MTKIPRIAVARVAAHHGYIEPAKTAWLYLAGIVIACFALSHVVYSGIERPMTAYCRRLLLGSVHRLAA